MKTNKHEKAGEKGARVLEANQSRRCQTAVTFNFHRQMTRKVP